MKVVLDTNVFVSGVFFGGPPHKILEAWRDGKIQLLLSPAILEEYQRVMRELAVQFPEIKVEALIDFMIVHSEIILPPTLPQSSKWILPMTNFWNVRLPGKRPAS